MKRSMMQKNLRQSIIKSLGRYLAILAIIALGCSIFVGLRITKSDMVATGQAYTDSQNMFDLRLLSSYGWDFGDVEKIAAIEGIQDAEGSVTLDVYVRSEQDNEDLVYRLYSLPQNVNQVYLLGGRMPQSADECLVDGTRATDAVLGTKITVSDTNSEDALDSLHHRTYTVVGYISTPLYMDMTRGSTSLGNGSLTSYLYIPMEAFDVDYFTEINVTLPGDWTIYSEGYTNAMEEMAALLEPKLEGIALKRFEMLKQDAENAYSEGLQAYLEGKQEYEEGKATADKELTDALKQLQDAQAEIDQNRQKLQEGEVQLQDAVKLLEDNTKKLAEARKELEKAKTDTYAQLAAGEQELRENEKKVNDSLTQIQEALPQLDDGLGQIADGLAQIEEGLPMLELAITLGQVQVENARQQLELAKLTGNPTWIAQAEEALTQQQAQLDDYFRQRTEAVQMRAQLEKQQQELTAQRETLQQTQENLLQAQNDIAKGYEDLKNGREQADREFAAAEAELTDAEQTLEKGRKELNSKSKELEEGKAALADAEKELDNAWQEYESGKQEAEVELADAAAKLADAEKELADARETIDAMEQPTVYALTRNTNAGYLALDSNSDIVSGVAVVLPVFFLLIAALVCITTMTRMIEEERTEIGTLKALGYSGYRIMGKYLMYSASASLIGCVLGIVVGCVFFPKLLWNAYGIIFNITPDVVLGVDWGLSLGITFAYLAVSSLMTWYCCHKTLREVPAELIRPKAPTTGKKILLERLPFWDSLGFLNKVMLRNVLRYRQRLLMMLVGIGGCTALLLTGFGMRDTIINIANIQYEEVSLFDFEVYFSEGQTPEQQEAFAGQLKGLGASAGFFYQSSVELEHDGKTRDVNLISMRQEIKNFVDFHRGEQKLDMPGMGEAYLSVGASELLGISIGDTVTIRTSDLKSLTLTISGIYDNHVQNYLVVTPETLAAQWGEAPICQMAYVTVKDGVDPHQVSGFISSMDQVLNLLSSADTAQMFDSMMEALEYVIVVIVASAGLLAAIVLYNLTNININERIREIATIKVLGFNSKETSAYVFKENILLTVVGAGLGLGLGRIFLEFVMSKIKIDIVWFATRLSLPSYIASVVLTLLCAAAVDVIFHKKLQKINMAEALKSVE